MNEDIEVLTSIYMDTYTQDPWNENWTPELVRQRISDLTVSPISINYVICDKSNAIVGALFGRRNIFVDSTELFIDEFFIASGNQRKGYGKKLLDYVGCQLNKEGYSCMILNTERGYPSESFYRKNGFRQKESNIFMYKDI